MKIVDENYSYDERECRFDTSLVRIRIPWTVCRSKRNAIVFDLKQASSVKVRRLKNGKNV